jgi:cytochrome c551/c552
MTLVCADCHMPEIDGGEMKPITMENNCQNCHQLTFDIEDPTRVVPHGSASDVVMMMREYYAFRYIYQNLDNKADQNDIVNAGNIFDARKARRPGREKKLRKDFQHSLNEQTVDSIEKLTQQTIRSDGLVWAESRAYVAATDIFERQACVVCHVVTKNNDAEIPWEVKPVKLTKQWLPMANFTHDAHQNSDCESCHEASSSKVSSDILIPDIDNCQQCHGGEESHNLIPNTCIDCHDYHDAKTHVLGRQGLSQNTDSPLPQTKIALE